MRVPGLKSMCFSGRWLRSRLINGALILGYHSVAESTSDPFSLSVSAKHFAEQLAYIRKYACPIRLQTLVNSLKDGKVPRRGVVITFDDGYADNLYVAKPLLEKYEIPATVFIATGYLGRQFWWDELDGILLSMNTFPNTLSLTINGSVFHWKISDLVPTGSKNKILGRTRQVLLHSLYRLFEPLSEKERQEAMNQMRRWMHMASHSGSARQALSPDEVILLAEGNLIEVGAHTMTHPLLATLSPTLQRSEILQSRITLEEILNRPITSFSYPHGSLSDETVKIVQQAGFSCACGSITDVAWGRSDPFRLPRLWVRNSGALPFTPWSSRWLSPARALRCNS